jgi:uncharacterized protein (TIGR00661 family)
MKYLFFVQTDGRGHMTQAITLKEKLEKNGHSVVGLVIGSDKNKKLPTFFTEQFTCPLFDLASPKFLATKDGKGVRVIASFFYTIYKLRPYLNAIWQVRKIINTLQPEAIINFYEPLAGNYYRLFRERRPMFCLGHQFFINHPAFKNPEINFIDKLFFRFYNYLTSSRRALKIALSFSQEADLPKKKLFVCPPLIREAIKNSATSNANFILAYILSAGFSQEIITWSQEHPNYQVEAFWDKHEQEETLFGENLVFHYLNGEKFINRLSACSAYVATAGFDSIAEAAYLQKKILMIPTKNHFEQKSNAADAKRVGIAISANNFDLSLVAGQQQKTQSSAALRNFKEWIDGYDDKIINLLENKPL